MQLFQRFFLFLMGKIGQHLHRKALFVVHAFGHVGIQVHILACLHAAGPGGDHPAEAESHNGKHIAADLQRGHARTAKQPAAQRIDHAVSHSRCQRRCRLRHRQAADAGSAEDDRKGDAGGQQRNARTSVLFALLRTFSTGVGSGKPNIWRAHWGMPVLPAAAVPSAAFRRASCWFL